MRWHEHDGSPLLGDIAKTVGSGGISAGEDGAVACVHQGADEALAGRQAPREGRVQPGGKPLPWTARSDGVPYRGGRQADLRGLGPGDETVVRGEYVGERPTGLVGEGEFPIVSGR